MHYLIKLIVQADTAKEALQQADTDAQQLVDWAEFDWYAMDGRWGDSKAHRVTSATGRQLLEDGMKANREEFDRALEGIRYMMDHFSDEQIYEENFGKEEIEKSGMYLSKYQFSIAGGDTNRACVYAVDGDLWGGKVDKDSSLKHILENNKDKKLWVVPVDFHN